MKRILLFTIAAVLFLGNMHAQQSAPILLNYSTLQKKVERSNDRIEHHRRGEKPRTWVNRGELFQDVENLGLEQITIGMNKSAVKIFYSDPISEEVNDENVEVLTYEHWKYLFEDNLLRGWVKIDPIHENPLDEAFRSYKKAIELTEEDDKMNEMEKMKDQLAALKGQYQRAGQNHYYQEDLDAALNDFESILSINELPVFDGVIDTLMINYSGIVAREIGRRAMEAGNEEKGKKMYKKTIDLYKKLTELGSGGASTYIQMTRDYYAAGDTLGAIDNLKDGIERYPDSTILVTVAAQAYYLMDDNEGGLEFVNQRIENKPDCPAAYYWKGLLITNVDNVSEDTIKISLDLYDKSLELDPTNGNVWYQAGYVNYAIGANYYEQESYEEDDELRKELNKKGRDYYITAAEKLEKTYEVSEDDPVLQKESLDLLKRIYYKLYGGEDERYQEINRRLKEL
ncbi:MAG TPA: hypothetical protein VJ951_11730 [Bacteroidales bacterium]|nr:hypothetical protein [Bacteroidales bacterium]